MKEREKRERWFVVERGERENMKEREGLCLRQKREMVCKREREIADLQERERVAMKGRQVCVCDKKRERETERD